MSRTSGLATGGVVHETRAVPGARTITPRINSGTTTVLSIFNCVNDLGGRRPQPRRPEQHQRSDTGHHSFPGTWEARWREERGRKMGLYRGA
eukprot:CAMPEP_0179131780 /NCGR_PEP_ID=MMETSP0796-20121207/62611_1 /TAXON_ID=73915 /ORGANISM="Pyrodinium bahamense, Strain pbaha01" /LENGTH=91 /DNA_ID=CAMNT_0020830711 /DNA_START=568 /DNA_END=839 /DNA_ORIENTATION=-